MAEGLLWTRTSQPGSVNNISVPKVEMHAMAWIPRASEATDWAAVSDSCATFICAIGGDCSPVELSVFLTL